MINRAEQGTVMRTDEGKTYTELGVKRTPMDKKKKVESKKKDMAKKMGKEMPYSMGNKNSYSEGPGQRFPMSAKGSMSSGGMPYNMGKATDKMTEKSKSK